MSEYQPRNLTERTIYEQLWHVANPSGSGELGGAAAVDFFTKSKIEPSILKQIWALSTPFSTMTMPQFFAALRYILLVQNNLVPISKGIIFMRSLFLIIFKPSSQNALKAQVMWTSVFPAFQASCFRLVLRLVWTVRGSFSLSVLLLSCFLLSLMSLICLLFLFLFFFSFVFTVFLPEAIRRMEMWKWSKLFGLIPPLPPLGYAWHACMPCMPCMPEWNEELIELLSLSFDCRGPTRERSLTSLSQQMKMSMI